jgi:hypothetical protein
VDVCVTWDAPLYWFGQWKIYLLKFIQPERKATANLHFITQSGKLIVVAVEGVSVDENF